MRRGLFVGAALAALVAAAPATTRAEATPGATSDVAVEVVPIFDAALGGFNSGWNEIIVRIRNNGAKPARGTIEITSEQLSHEPTVRTIAEENPRRLYRFGE